MAVWNSTARHTHGSHHPQNHITPTPHTRALTASNHPYAYIHVVTTEHDGSTKQRPCKASFPDSLSRCSQQLHCTRADVVMPSCETDPASELSKPSSFLNQWLLIVFRCGLLIFVLDAARQPQAQEVCQEQTAPKNVEAEMVVQGP